MAVVERCVDNVPGLFEALAAGDRAGIEVHKERIDTIEAEADKVKNTLRENLPRGLFLPVDRRDLLEVLDMQDSIADVAQDIAGLLYERDMEVPPPIADALQPFVMKCIEVCHQSFRIINELDELLEMGFGGREADKVEGMVHELNLMEDETDELEQALTRTLFENEDDMKPLSVMFWYRLIEWIGDLADYAEKVGNRLRLLIAR
jgi:predicted phosphate transport protein (TIGR00153 family)